MVAGGSGTLALALLSAAWSTLSWLKLKQKRNSFGKESRLNRLEYNDLSIPKGKFSDGNKTGAGSSGRVYKGKVRGRDVAVKKIPQDSQGKFKDFLTELGTIGETGHENLVNIEGWCCSIKNFLIWCLDRQNTELFIIYELVPNGNLHEHLYDREEVLPWAMRYVRPSIWIAHFPFVFLFLLCFVIQAYFGEIYFSLEQRKLSKFIQAHIYY